MATRSWNSILDGIDPQRRQREAQSPAYIFNSGRRFVHDAPGTGVYARPTFGGFHVTFGDERDAHFLFGGGVPLS